jgi:hypothetical protein
MRAAEAGVKQSAKLSFRIEQRFPCGSKRLNRAQNRRLGLEIAINEML